MFSCGTQRKVAENNVYNKSYNQYLSLVINDTVFFEFTQFSIVDKSVFPILDSVISLSEKCQYLDPRVRYLNSFRFGIVHNGARNLFSINAHLSPAHL